MKFGVIVEDVRKSVPIEYFGVEAEVEDDAERAFLSNCINHDFINSIEIVPMTEEFIETAKAKNTHKRLYTVNYDNEVLTVQGGQ